MTLNRKNPPDVVEIKSIHIKEAQDNTLTNGIKLYTINASNEEVIKIDLVFDAGTNVQDFKSQSNFTSKMLSEGTSKYSAAELAEKLDFYGAYFQTKNTTEEAIITLYCLNKHLNNCLPFIVEILTDSIFPEKDLEILKKNAIQNLKVNEERNSYLVRRAFNQAIFGENTLYGSYSSISDIEQINKNQLISFYQTHYQKGFKYILASGFVKNETIETINKYFGTKTFTKYNNLAYKYVEQVVKPTGLYIDKTNSVQSAIRIGRRLFNRNHPDFREMQLLNLILGGYFGSRLMKNIREEKGLTYGIYSAIEAYPFDACWYIDTEMNNDLCETGIIEIYKEIAQLRDELIGEKELKTAKNYLLGSFLRSIDGPFSLADRFKILKDFDLEYAYFYEFIEIIKRTTAERLKELANLYLREEDLTQVIVGTKKV
ncbi:MAG: insulinase family protein [Bacteroidia bacterium]|nr:insulinase family protein [Bacteroidia bacterium]